MPDYDHIRREFLRNGVNKKFLWIEYCEERHMNGEKPLMYSQFCYYIQKDEEKRRATIHITRKPGEKIGPVIRHSSSIQIPVRSRRHGYL